MQTFYKYLCAKTTVSLVLICITALCYRAYSQDISTIGKQKPVSFGGGLSISSSVYSLSSADTNMQQHDQPFSYTISGNLTTNIYGIALPISFTYSNREKNFRQPFNQIGASPSYKWIKLHLGYRNLIYSPYTLSGHTMLGSGLELNPGKFRFGLMYGRLNRNIDKFDASRNVQPVFLRKGFATRLGFGTSKSFFDLIVLKAKDDTTSLKKEVYDSLARPSDNFVVGYSTRFNKKWFYFESDAAISFYTTNMFSQALDTSNRWIKKANSLLLINASTEYYSAFSTSLGYKFKTHSLRMQYRRIDPNYRTMGAYFFNNDVEQITLAPSANLLKQRLTISANAGIQHDNLRKTKKATSYRKVGSANVNFNPSQKFGVTANYSNFSSDQQAGSLPLIDSTRLFQTTRNMLLMPRLLFTDTVKSQAIMLTYSAMWMEDKNPATAKYTNLRNENIMLNYTHTRLKSGLSMFCGVNYTNLTVFSGNNTMYGFNWGVSKSFFESNLYTGFTNVISKAVINNEKSLIINAAVNISYRIGSKNNFYLNTYITQNNSKSLQSPQFNEFRGDLGYVFSF